MVARPSTLVITLSTDTRAIARALLEHCKNVATTYHMRISHAEVHPGGPMFGHRAPQVSSHVGGARGRGAEASAAQIARSQKRRLQELAQENFRDVKMELPPQFVQGGLRPGKTVNTRRVLASKKMIANVFDDDVPAAEEFMSLAMQPSRYPSRPRCAVCGYFSKTTCIRCGAKHCSARCTRVHSERCD